MPRIYKLSRAGLRLLYKIRHHKGHGIHSPFVFNLITKVIEDKSSYPAYDDIKSLLGDSSSQRRFNKYSRLYYRLTDYFEVKQVLELGSGYGIDTLSVTAPSTNTSCTCIELSERKRAEAQKLYSLLDKNIVLYKNLKEASLNGKQDCISIDLNSYNKLSDDIIKYISSLSHEKTFIIVKGIRTNKRHQMLWRDIIRIDSRTAVLDLFNVGIIFFDKRLYRWSYQISF